MRRFSERIGKRNIKVEIQLGWMDEDLQNSLWNILDHHIMKPMKEENSVVNYSEYKELIYSIWFSFFKLPLDTIPFDTNNVVFKLRNLYFGWDYLDTYDFIDFIANKNSEFDQEIFIKDCNSILKRELSGYRFVNGLLMPITSELEINQIEIAIQESDNNNFEGVNIHLKSALEKISDRKNPDYRNSIKESISAIESICQVLTDEQGAELGKTLKLLESKMPLHGALKQGFTKLYGYTSDSDGIRHAMMDSDNLDQEDAVYMLVTCSSFINYLIRKAQKAGLLNKKYCGQ